MKARDLLLRKTGLGLEADEPKVDETEKADDAAPEEKEESSDDTKEPAEDQGKEGDDETAKTDEEEESTDVDEGAGGDSDADSDPVSSDSDSSDASAEEPASDGSTDSDEDQTEETTVPVEGEVQSSLGDEEKALLKLNGFEVNDEDLEEAVEEVGTAQEALESIYLQIQSSLESGGLTKDAFVLATTYANTVTKSVGLESIGVGLESADTRYQLSVVAMESIGDKIKEAGKAVKEFILKLWNWFVEHAKKVFNFGAAQAKRVQAIFRSAKEPAMLVLLNAPESQKSTADKPAVKQSQSGIDVSKFRFGGKNQKNLGSDLLWCVDKNGALFSQDNVSQLSAICGDAFAYCEKLGKDGADEAEQREQMKKLMTGLNKSLGGIKTDRDGFVENYPSQHKHGYKYNPTSDSLKMVETPIERGEPEYLPLTLSDLGVSVEMVKKIADRLDALNDLLQASSKSLDSLTARVEHYNFSSEVTENAKAANLFARSFFSNLAGYNRVYLRCAGGVMSAISELGKAVKTANAAV